MITVEYIYPAISLERVLHVWADSVSPLMSTTASRDKFKPIGIGENLEVNLSHVFVLVQYYYKLLWIVLAISVCPMCI